MTESSDPRLETAHIKKVVAAWEEMVLPHKPALELFATEILRLRSGAVEWTEKAPEERGWYWFAEKPDPGSTYRYRTHPGVKLVEVRRANNDTMSLYIEGGRFLYADDVKGAKWAKAAVPASPFEEAKT